MLIIIEGCSSESQTEREGKEQGKGAAINQYKIVESIENMKRVWSQITKTHKEKVLKKRCLMSQATLRRVGVLRLCGIVWQVNKNEPTKSVANKKMFAAELFTKRLQQQQQQHGARRTQHLAYLASSCNIPATLPLPLVSIADFFGGPRRVGAAAAGTCPKGASSLCSSLSLFMWAVACGILNKYLPKQGQGLVPFKTIIKLRSAAAAAAIIMCLQLQYLGQHLCKINSPPHVSIHPSSTGAGRQ